MPGIPWPRPPSLQSSGEFGTELQAPERMFLSVTRTPRSAKIKLDITQAQAEHMISHVRN